MNISLLIALVVAGLIICNSNIREVFVTFMMVWLFFLFDKVCFAILTDNQIFGNLSVIWEVIIIAIMIIPWLWIKNDIKFAIGILYFYFNKKKILNEGSIEKGKIEKFTRHGLRGGLYLIVSINGERIKSLTFEEYDLQYKYLFTNKADRYEKAKELYKLAQQKNYKVGNEIDVILYKNWKFVKLYNMK